MKKEPYAAPVMEIVLPERGGVVPAAPAAE